MGAEVLLQHLNEGTPVNVQDYVNADTEVDSCFLSQGRCVCPYIPLIKRIEINVEY